jgi:hypothetical protein
MAESRPDLAGHDWQAHSDQRARWDYDQSQSQLAQARQKLRDTELLLGAAEKWRKHSQEGAKTHG